MSTQVLGRGPVGFTNSNGNQVFIPLSDLYFDTDGKIKPDSWPAYPDDEQTVNGLLNELVEGGFLIAGTEAPIKPAMLIEAAISGAIGNHIQIDFGNIVVDSTTPANSTFDCTITTKDTYLDLSFDSTSSSFIKKIVGTETIVGSTSSLVRIKDADTPSLPKLGSYVLTDGSATDKAFKAIDGDPSGTAFTLEAWKNGANGQYITATIPQVDATAKTFTLVVEWKQPVTGIKVADLPAKLVGDGLLLKVSQSGGANFAIPVSGPIILNGGADAKAATIASAIAIAQP